SELREKSVGELRKELQDNLKEQFNLRMQKGSGQLSRPDRVKSVRRNIARINTIMNEKKRQDNGS
ncbi:MAG: 50S ribosomal protein L29, partial [Gammaproteobacteria bacterium]|nr:50S ribosomal protein L29 [Gammaproteobacteria bacterium]